MSTRIFIKNELVNSVIFKDITIMNPLMMSNLLIILLSLISYFEMDIIQSYVGDAIVTFNITSSGQLQYTVINYPGFVSLTFKYKVITN